MHWDLSCEKVYKYIVNINLFHKKRHWWKTSLENKSFQNGKFYFKNFLALYFGYGILFEWLFWLIAPFIIQLFWMGYLKRSIPIIKQSWNTEIVLSIFFQTRNLFLNLTQWNYRLIMIQIIHLSIGKLFLIFFYVKQSA